MFTRVSANHSYFYDALSGEFTPPTDPLGRKHTLGRLMLGTFEKGAVENPNSHREMRIYTPSWAPISSVVGISHWDIRSLTLEAEDRTISFEHTLEDRASRRLRITDTALGFTPVFDIELGHQSDYAVIQDVTTRTAQDFFDSLVS